MDLPEELLNLESSVSHRRSIYASTEFSEDERSVPSTPKRQTDDSSLDLVQSPPNLPKSPAILSAVSQKPILETSSSQEFNRLRSASNQSLRFRFRDGKPKSRFADLNSKAHPTILDESTAFGSKFYGFFVAIWFGVALVGFDSLVHHTLTKGSIHEWDIARIMRKDAVAVGLTDLAMYLAMYVSVAIQNMVKLNWIKWRSTGWVLQSVFEFAHLVFFIWYANYKNYPWIGKVFLCLHSLVMLMKMHSYAFYNGYFWNISHELQFSKNYKQTNPKLDEKSTELVEKSIEFCQFELDKNGMFPSNLTVSNFFDYSMFPTVVYEVKYPRTAKVRWGYFSTKVCGIFGVILMMIIVAQNWLYPLAMQCIELRGQPFIERAKQYPLIVLDLVPPFLLMYLLVFYLIWELILNAIAELSRFGDRNFYGAWWNSVTWDEFARDWNSPVHKFLLRHVYHSSISALNLSKVNATVFTFLLSSIVHELVMFVIFRKFRGYLLALQMFQLPLVGISRSKFMRDQKILGNVIFWFGIATGPSLMCSLYLTF
ncbi:unnamed protein product [Kuraishia capsulata CBS 1993]|uniref:O-acyltransferase n=1 Tax=Kuraishia capsulata CBS 1993 TaxID=1382522 RepID=W6MWQ6_9ASCO|nr:uncharacterized protein KUCA_T00003729001 [Kuraishia capsulata CBS 1993]CDK27750.1 unnamed protein product [Kuraishia capsulata CBS 1993]